MQLPGTVLPEYALVSSTSLSWSLSLLYIQATLHSQSWFPQMLLICTPAQTWIHLRKEHFMGWNAPSPPIPWCHKHPSSDITVCPENRSTENKHKCILHLSLEPDVWKPPLTKKLPQIIHSFTTQEIYSFHWKVMTLSWTSSQNCSELFLQCL